LFKKIVVIKGMPRSGTSWLSQIFDSSPQVRFRLSPLFSYELKNYVDEKSPLADWEYVFQKAYDSDSDFMNQTEQRKAGGYPFFSKKDLSPEYLVIKDTRFHNLIERMLALFDNLKIVAIVRHPCGAIHSWLSTPGEFPKDANPMDEWLTGACRKTGFGEFWGFEDWKKVTLLHMKLEREMPDRFIIQRYEDLVMNPVAETKLLTFCGLKYNDQTDEFLRRCHEKHSDNTYAVFKNQKVIDKWRENLQPEIQQAILKAIRGTDLERFL
jgi:hypothetical protein